MWMKKTIKWMHHDPELDQSPDTGDVPYGPSDDCSDESASGSGPIY